jgi:hypothetical protein
MDSLGDGPVEGDHLTADGVAVVVVANVLVLVALGSLEAEGGDVGPLGVDRGLSGVIGMGAINESSAFLLGDGDDTIELIFVHIVDGTVVTALDVLRLSLVGSAALGVVGEDGDITPDGGAPVGVVITLLGTLVGVTSTAGVLTGVLGSLLLVVVELVGSVET